jgi:uncharacterized protein (DUF111 family)
MIYIDAREGLSGDMILAALLGLLGDSEREEAITRLQRASTELGIEMRVARLEDAGDPGLGISYIEKETGKTSASYQEAHKTLRTIETTLKSESSVGVQILEQIFKAEASAHGVAKERVHLHEIGRPEALVNMAGIGLVSSILQESDQEGFACTTITTGHGVVAVSHGAVRIPSPASEFLLKGMKHRRGDGAGERATPTGIAAIRVLAKLQSDQLPSVYSKRSVGFGTKRFGGRLGRVAMLWQ